MDKAWRKSQQYVSLSLASYKNIYIDVVLKLTGFEIPSK